MTGGSLSFSLMVSLSNLISNRFHWGVELHSQSRNSVQKKKGWGGKSQALTKVYVCVCVLGGLSKCYLTISRARGKTWETGQRWLVLRKSGCLVLWKHSLWQMAILAHASQKHFTWNKAPHRHEGHRHEDLSKCSFPELNRDLKHFS